MRELVVPCRDLGAAVAACEALGFAVELVVPADEPRIVVVVREPVRVRLVRGDGGDVRIEDALHVALEVPPPRGELVVTRASEGAWHVGRAGMAYRDLVPERLGGWLVASHIRIVDGGPVGDYVHFHDLRAQILYCRSGWVRVVYEDQGEPFVMSAGECIVQPPRIRHRVLECSPGFEIIEVAVPAVHATYADRQLALPNATRDPERRWNGQRFLHARGDDLELSRALGQDWTGRVVHAHASRRQVATAVVFGFVLSGEVDLTCDDLRAQLARDDAYCLPLGATYETTGQCELLELELA
jgi:mannose-6-phosphate isomerase-like protein (cupin superfamily)